MFHDTGDQSGQRLPAPLLQGGAGLRIPTMEPGDEIIRCHTLSNEKFELISRSMQDPERHNPPSARPDQLSRRVGGKSPPIDLPGQECGTRMASFRGQPVRATSEQPTANNGPEWQLSRTGI